MIKNYCLIFLILFSQILLAQTDLARWNNTNLSATNYSPANIEVTNLKAVGVSNAVQGGFYYNGANHNIFSCQFGSQQVHTIHHQP